jgi:hypothetical protein
MEAPVRRMQDRSYRRSRSPPIDALRAGPDTGSSLAKDPVEIALPSD